MSDADDEPQILTMNVRSIIPMNTSWTNSEALGIQVKINLH